MSSIRLGFRFVYPNHLRLNPISTSFLQLKRTDCVGSVVGTLASTPGCWLVAPKCQISFYTLFIVLSNSGQEQPTTEHIFLRAVLQLDSCVVILTQGRFQKIFEKWAGKKFEIFH